MTRIFRSFLALALLAATVQAADWSQFRGPDGLGISLEQKSPPTKWSSSENVAWKAALPGPGASSPMVAKGRVYVTCYTGYGLEPNSGDQKDLRRHLLSFDRKNGQLVWSKEFEPKLPEHKYQGEGSYHGYAASTPLRPLEFRFVRWSSSRRRRTLTPWQPNHSHLPAQDEFRDVPEDQRICPIAALTFAKAVNILVAGILSAILLSYARLQIRTGESRC